MTTVDYDTLATRLNRGFGTDFSPSLYNNAIDTLKAHYARKNG